MLPIDKHPEPPIGFDRPWAEIGSRLGAEAVALGGDFLERLSGACDRVDTDDESCIEVGRDWWPIAIRWATEGQTAMRAGAVARPTDAGQVAAVLAICDEARVPVTVAAGRSGVCGGSVPVFGGVVMDMCAMAGITDVDDVSLLVDVLPGTFGDLMETELRSAHRLTLGHWPQSIAISTVGGYLACRSAGQYSTRYGKIEDMVVGLEVALAGGRLVRTGGTAPRAAAGPDLNQLFVGSEGTLGVITGARLRAHPLPPVEARRAFGFRSFSAGLDACRRILRRGANPAVVRLYDSIESARHFRTEGICVLIVLDEGDEALTGAVARVVDGECAGEQRLDDYLVARWLETRNDVSALGPLVSSGIVVDTAEVSARWSALAELHDAVVDALSSIEGTLVASAHQSHSYTDGACLYFTFAGQGPDLGDRSWAESYYNKAWRAVMEATIAAGGAISHHHGIGLNRSKYLSRSLGDGFGVLSSIKSALDPNSILNPGKLGLASPFGEVPWP